jgi:hypothetical protein
MTIHSNSTLAMGELVKRLGRNPKFMAYVLFQYQDQEGISDENLPAVLGTLPELVSRLALCRKPDADKTSFAERVREIADYTLVDESLLANIIRQVGSIEALSKSPEHRFLAAARDHGDIASEEESPPPTKKPEGKK